MAKLAINPLLDVQQKYTTKMIINPYRFKSSALPMRWTIDTSKGDGLDQLQFPTRSGYSYNVNYTTSEGGSGSFNAWDDPNTLITFTGGVGTKWVEFTDTIEAIYFNNGGDKLKVTGVVFGQIGLISAAYAFYGCANNISISGDMSELNSLTDGSYMFRDNQLTSLPSSITLSSLTIGNHMFRGSQFTSLPSTMLLSNLESGSNMFHYNLITSLPTGMTLSNLVDGRSMFQGNPITNLPSSMTLSSLENGQYMFYFSQLTSLPSAMLLSNLESGGGMFYSNDIGTLPSSMTLSNLVDGTSMFYNNDLTILPTGMTLSNLGNGSSMFRDNQITSISSSMTLSSLANGINMFLNNTINTTDYSQLLINTANAAPSIQSNVTFHGGSSKYNSGAVAARAVLTGTYTWSITDGGLA